MPRVLATCLALSCANVALAGGFFLTIGNPVAGNAPQFKSAVLVVRPDGCGEPAKAQITGTAEGVWVVSLTGKYHDATTSAIVPIGAKGFLRESSKFFPRAATEAEIEGTLKALAASQARQ